MMTVTQIPKTPPYVKGVINLRGKVIPVVDLRLRFSMEETGYTDRTCIVVVDIRHGSGQDSPHRHRGGRRFGGPEHQGGGDRGNAQFRDEAGHGLHSGPGEDVERREDPARHRPGFKFRTEHGGNAAALTGMRAQGQGSTAALTSRHRDACPALPSPYPNPSRGCRPRRSRPCRKDSPFPTDG